MTIQTATIPLSRSKPQFQKDIDYAVEELEKWGQDNNFKVHNMKMLPANQKTNTITIECEYSPLGKTGAINNKFDGTDEQILLNSIEANKPKYDDKLLGKMVGKEAAVTEFPEFAQKLKKSKLAKV